MEAFEVGLILSRAELSLLMKILNLAPPEELPLAPGGEDEACARLEDAGILLRDEKRLAIDRSVARMVGAVAGRRWALTVESVAINRAAFGGDGLCVVAERLAGERWLLTPFPTARGALAALSDGAEGASGELRAAFAGPEERALLSLPAQELRAFLEDALTDVMEG